MQKENFPKITVFEATATAKKVLDANKKRVSATIYNNESTNIPEVITSKDAKYGQGKPIPAKDEWVNEVACTGAYYVICDTGLTADLRIEEEIEK